MSQVAVYNLIPDTDEYGASIGLASATRVYLFKFTTTTGGAYDGICSSLAASSTEEVILSIAPEGGTNIINSTNVTVVSLQASISASTSIAISSTRSNVKCFTINSLAANTTYYMITRTTYNDSGADVALSLYSQVDGSSPVITLLQYSQQTLNGYVGKNLIPDRDPTDRSTLSGSYTRYYLFKFKPAFSTYDVYLNSNTTGSTQERIVSIYKTGGTNLIGTASITGVTTITLSGTEYVMANSMANLKAFTLNSLDTTADYFIITRSTSNDTTTVDLSMILYNAANNSSPLIDYVRASSDYINNLVIGYDLIPNVDPSGGAIQTAATQTRFYKFKFTAAASTYDAYLTSFTGSTTQERIVGIYTSAGTNIINTTNITIIANCAISTNAITISTVGTNVKAFTIKNLSVGTDYFIITKTTYNDAQPDLELGLYNAAANPPSPVFYYQEAGLNLVDSLIIGRDIIPNVDNTGAAITTGSGTRFFTFRFLANTTTYDAYITTNSFASTHQEQIVCIYIDGDTTYTNMIGAMNASSVAYVTTISGVTMASGIISLTNSMDNVRAFTLSGLIPGSSYCIVTKTTSNDTTPIDVNMGLYNATATPPSPTLDYIDTGTVYGGGRKLIANNVITDIDEYGISIPTGSNTRFYRFTFTPTTNSYDAYLTTSSTSATQEQIVSIFKTGGPDIIGTADLPSVLVGTISGGAITLANGQGSVKTFTMNNLIPNTEYNIITSTTSNDAGADVSMALYGPADGSTLVLNLVQTGPICVNNMIFGRDVIPNVDQNGTAITTGSGTRFFTFNFTPTASSLDAYISTISTASTQEIIYSIYKTGTSINMINGTNITGLTNTTISGTTLTLSNSMSNVKAFTIGNLDIGSDYYIVTRTTSNDTLPDVTLGLYDSINNSSPSLTYMTTTALTAVTPVIVDTDPISGADLTSSGTGINPIVRLFTYKFSPTASSCQVIISTNSSSGSDQECIQSIYKANTTTNIINATNITNLVTVTLSGNIITFGNSMSNVNAFTINNLDITAEYYIVVKTPQNGVGSVDVSMGIYNPLTLNIMPLEYVANDAITLSSVIRDTDNSGNTISTGLTETKYYKYLFAPTSTSYDAYMTTNSITFSEETIIAIYSTDINIISPTSVTNMNVASLSTPAQDTIILMNSYKGLKAFTLSNLDTSKYYYIIFKTTYNDTDGAGMYGTDVAFALYNYFSKSTAPLTMTTWSTSLTQPDPINVTISNVSSDKFLQWNNPIGSTTLASISGYKIYTKLTTDTTYTLAGTTTTTSYTVTGLTADAIYDFKLTSYGAGGESAGTIITKPGTPSAPSTIAGNQSLSITFNAPSTGGSPITEYQYALTNDANTVWTSNGISRSITVSGLQNGVSQTVYIRAVNIIGPGTPLSVTATPCTIPDAPGTPTATYGNASATVSFNAPAWNGGSSISSYTVISTPGNITKLIYVFTPAASYSTTVTGLTNGTSYTFRVIATNNAGDSLASAASNAVTPRTVPSAPTSVSAVASPTQATISFTPTPTSANGGSEITEYIVTSSPGEITTSGAGSGIVVTGLTNGTAYTFTVKAVNSEGQSAASAASNQVTPLDIPAAPTDISAVAGPTRATISFTPVPNESNGGSPVTSYVATSTPGGRTGSGTTSGIVVNGLTNGTSYTFTVVAITAGGTSPTSAISNTVTPVDVPAAPTNVSAVGGNGQATISFTPVPLVYNGGSPITDYHVTATPGGMVASGTGSEIVFTGLTNGTSYTFKVRAQNSVGYSTASAASNSVTPMTIPAAPTGVSAAPGAARATISFTPVPESDNGGSAITSYVATSSPGGFTGSGATSGVVVTGLTNGATYTFTVVAINEVGSSVSSDVTNSVTPVDVPLPPTGVSAVAGDGRATISFTPVSEANNGGLPVTAYHVTATPGNISVSGTGSEILFTGLTNGTAYTFRVRAQNAAGYSAASLPSSAVTPALSGPVAVLQAMASIPGVIADSTNFASAVSNATFSSVTPVNLTNFGVNIAAAGASASSVRQNLFKYIFEARPSINSVIVNRDEIAISNTGTANANLFVVRPAASVNDPPVAIDELVNATTSVYAPLSTVGDINKFSIGSSVFTIAKISSTVYYFTNAAGVTSEHLEGDVIVYKTVTIEFGSAIITLAPPHLLAPSPIEVNFEVEITGNSNLEVFGDQFIPVSNIVEANTTLPVNALYDSVDKTGLIELWEPEDDPDNIYVQLANTNSSAGGGPNLTGAYTTTLKQLAKGLQRILCGSFDCSNATPFNATRYQNTAAYRTQRDFGRLALAAFAHYLFGHVDASSAITNDTAFVKNMLSLAATSANTAATTEDEITGPALRYAAYNPTYVAEIENNPIADWSNKTGSNTDANLARRLTAAIIGKGLNNGAIEVSKVNDPTISDAAVIKSKLAYIVRQVVGQDGTRLMNEDNSERTRNQHQLLRFYEGDIIYLRITLNTPTINVGEGQQSGLTETVFQNSYTATKYALKITLGPREIL